MYHTMATTPILLLRGQAWLDEHNVRVDLSNRFGQVAQQVSAQGTDLLNNAITILSETANILLDIILILIISFYLLSDGGNLIHRGLSIIPSGGREQAWFFVKSLDAVLGGYIRGQLLLSVLAGVLGGGGAEVLGVPYPLLIGIMTGLLEAVPVIGPMVAAFPAVIVALFFTPFATAVILLVWFIVFQQLVTNVLGPRVMGKAVGIHPLEAMLAVLIGYPVGGFLGAFLAVPVMGIVHILVREAYAYFVLGRAFPSVELPEPVEEPRPVTARPVVKPTGTDPV
jgi:predicted PurR-regulated permease PerM